MIGAGWCRRVAWSVVLVSVISAPAVFAASQTLFGPEQFTRTTGPTTVYTRSFTVPPAVVAPFTLHIVNGNPNATSNRVAIEDAVSSGRVLINGTEVVSPNEFSRTTAVIDKTVALLPANTLEIRLNSAPASYITLSISGISNNRAPVADAGPDQAVATGSLVTLDGSGSSDLDGDLLTYTWSLTTVPAGSTAAISSSTAVRPTFTADVDGVYRVSLVVSDGLRSSAADDVVITATQPNTPPTAQAGPDQHVLSGTLVTLDGSLSFDPDHDLITYLWTFVSRPTGSTATLSDPAVIRPTFTADVAGGYTIRLIVNDGTVNSAPDDVVVTAAPPNNPPVANAGPDQAVVTDTVVTLNGSASYDPDGDPLTFQWSLASRPAGSSAALTNPTTVAPTFTPDVSGQYVINLVVHDGTLASAVDIVVVVAERPNAAPTANAGPDQTIQKGNAVTLNGTASFDPDNDPITYAWNFVSIPTGSSAALSGSTTAQPTFTADKSGDYVARLIVNDGLLNSAPDAVVIISVNEAPVASAGPDQAARVEEVVTLDARGSTDPDGDTLSFAWTVTSAPAGSSAVLASPATSAPTFTPDLPGTYVVSLVVSDGDVDSLPDDVVLTIRRRLVLVAITPAAPSVFLDETLQLTATGTYSDGGSADLTTTVTWASSEPNKASVSAAGVVSGLAPGSVTITARHDGVTGSQPLTVSLRPPVITSVDPTSGPIGTPVTITGLHFNAVTASDNAVWFNGTRAIISAATATTLRITVPLGATTGPITVTTSGGTATSAAPFTVTLSQNFALTLAPNPATVIQSDDVHVAVRATATNGFSGSVTLAVTGLPVDATATLSAPTITTGGLLDLTLRAATTLTPGSYPYTLTGTSTIDGQTITRTAGGILTVQSAGVTTITGQVLNTLDEPLEGVIITIDGQTGSTDAGGNFIVPNVVVGNGRVVFVDGRPVVKGDEKYPIVEAMLNVRVGIANRVPYIIWLPALSQHMTQIDPTKDTVVTNPDIPDMQVLIPKGTVLTTLEGTTVTEMSITQVPIDRAPMPLPEDWTVGSLFSIQPGGATANRPIPVIYPNTLGNEPGTRANLFFFDVEIGDWRVYGQGTVSQDGKRIIPDPGVGQPRTAWGAVAPPPPLTPSDEECETKCGDPVVLQTGQFTLEATDLVLPGRMPVRIRRAYRSPEIGFSAVTGLGLMGARTTLLDYNESLRFVGTQAMAYVVGYGQGTLSLQPDGTYANTTLPALRGITATLNPDGSRQIRLKDGRVKRFDTNGRLVEISDRSGNTVRIVRNEFGFISEIQEPAGRAIRFGYNDDFRLARVIDPLGREVQYGYDAPGRLVTVRDPEGGITRYTYDSNNRMLTITDARNIVQVTNEYNPAGRVVLQTHPGGGTWRYDYTLNGTIVSQTVMTDPVGHATTYRFNGLGYPTAVINALGAMTRLTRTFGTNQIEQVRDPLNRLTMFTYDLSGNITSVVDPAGQLTLLEYEPTFNSLVKVTDTLGRMTRLAYDATGSLTTITDPLNQVTTLTYNTGGQPTIVTDALGHTTQLEYDDAGNLIATTDPLGNRTRRVYDAISRLTSQTDPQGKTTTYTYDGLNRLTDLTDALAGVTHLTYDPNGNLLTLTDAKSQTTTYTYDLRNRVETRTDPLGRVEHYVYDGTENLTQVTDRKGQITTFTYDAANQRTGAAFADGTTLGLTYDPVGRMIGATDSATGTIQRRYDLLDRLLEEHTPTGAVAYTYDALGNRASLTVNGLPTTTYTYDGNSRLTHVIQGSQEVGLAYDAIGRRTALAYPNGVTTSYAYDLASRVTSITHSKGTDLIERMVYDYDAASNRKRIDRAQDAATLLPDAVQAAYDAANQQVLVNSPTPNLTYDANGNLTSQTDAMGTTTYAWDARNRLIGIIGPSVTASFSYDAFGRRLTKTVNGVSTQYLYDGQDIALEVGDGALAASYLRSRSIDEAFVRHGQDAKYYHADAVGSTLALTDQTGASQVQYEYEPFGRTTNSAASDNAVQYTGRENDGIGLYYYRGRYYSPTLQRFISEDPIGFAGQQASLYVYVFNAPLSFRDPTGLEVPFGVGAGIALGAIAVVEAARTAAAYPQVQEWGDVANARWQGSEDEQKHQWVSAKITEEYGPDIALIYGIGKEVKDLLDMNDNTSADWRDLLNDLIGIWDPEEVLERLEPSCPPR